MKVTFFINYLNHHQAPVADEMYRLLGDNFRYVATYTRQNEDLKGGSDYSKRPYCLFAAEDVNAVAEAHRLNRESDVCVYGAGNLDWERERAKTGKLSFEISERWFKRGFINILSPRLIKWWWLYQTKLRKKPFYTLCASGYTALDRAKLFTFKNRCYKWGYFTALPVSELSVNKNNIIQIMWCARLILWKHPEQPLQLAEKLKNDGYNFHINIVGDGEMHLKLEKLISEYGIADCVSLQGNLPNVQVLKMMSESDVFLFTSDRMEGWGAVVNEAMSSGCCVVANEAIGSTPYLIKEQETGLTYNGSIDSLYSQVKYLLDHLENCKRIGENSRRYIQQIWSPENAAHSLLTLISDISSCKDTSIKEGPCSKA